MIDKRISLLAGGHRQIVLLNDRLQQQETFLIDSEAGRGGSCLVYHARTCGADGNTRPVLLKEFFPVSCDGAIVRQPETGELLLAPDASELQTQRLRQEQELFTQSCADQRRIFRELASTAGDELIDIEDTYTAGKGLYVLLRTGGGVSWSCIRPRSPEESIQSLLETLLSTARELAVYHHAGWLYGDVKPENVYLFRKTRQHVRLMDFGSLQRLQCGRLMDDARLSWSVGYAAPEILDAAMAEEADRANYNACIGPEADIYSLGAVLYERLTGQRRDPLMPDAAFAAEARAALEALWAKEKNGWLKGCRHILIVRLEQLLRQMLAWNPEGRPGPESLVEQLTQLIRLSVPQHMELSRQCLPPAPVAGFVGRRRELDQLRAHLKEQPSPIWLCGDGGLGKSETALQLAQEARGEYDFFRIAFYQDLEQTICQLPVIPEAPDEEGQSDQERHRARYQRILSCLQQYGETGVLMIDQFDLSPEEEARVMQSAAYADLSRLDMHVILISRRLPPIEAPCVHLGTLEEDELLQLFRHCCGTPADDETILQLIRSAAHNTLVTELIARNMEQSWGRLTPEALLRSFSDGEDSRTAAVGARIRQLFDLTLLSPLSRKLMAQTCIFPDGGLNAWICLDCHSEAEQDRLRLLELSGWIRKSSANLLTVHPLIREMCRSALSEKDEACAAFLQAYRMRFMSLPHREKTENQYQFAAMLSCAASVLADPQGAYALEAGDVNYAAGIYKTALAHLMDYWPILISSNPVNPHAALSTLDRIASCCAALGRYEEAIYYERSGIAVYEKQEEKDPHLLASCYLNLGSICKRCDRLAEAQQAYAAAAPFLPGDDPASDLGIHQQLNLGMLYEQTGNYADAERLILQVLDHIQRATPRTPSRAALLASAWTTLGIIRERWKQSSGGYAAALSCYEKAVTLCEQVWGASHVQTAGSYHNMGMALTCLDRPEDALPWIEKELQIKLTHYGEWHPGTATAYHALADLCRKAGRLPEALGNCLKAKRIRSRFLPPDHLDLGLNEELHAAILLDMDGSARQDALQRQLNALALHHHRERDLPSKPRTDQALENLKRMYADVFHDYTPEGFLAWFRREQGPSSPERR